MDQIQIGKFIAELRKEKNMTQAQLGERLGVTNKTVSRWENGNYMPDLSVMEALCQSFDISVNELVSGKRLEPSEFKQEADHNLISSFGRAQLVRREKRIIDFFEGAGTGILVSTLISPDSARRTAAILVALAMIGIGTYRRARFDRRILEWVGEPEK